MEVCTKDNGCKISNMATVKNPGTITKLNTQEILIRVKKLEMAVLNLKVAIMKASFSMESFMGQENTIFQIPENFTKENLRKIIWMVKEL